MALVDDVGHALDARLASTLTALADRFRREYPAYRDDDALTEALEAAAQKIRRRERRQGVVDQLHRYAWITLKHVAISASRLARRRLIARTVGSEAGAIALSSLPSQVGTAEQIEDSILLRQVLSRLTVSERLMCRLRAAGHTSAEIADRLGTSAGAVDVAFVRLRRKLRRVLATSPRTASAAGRRTKTSRN